VQKIFLPAVNVKCDYYLSTSVNLNNLKYGSFVSNTVTEHNFINSK